MATDKKRFKSPPARSDAHTHDSRSAKDNTRVEERISETDGDPALALEKLNRKLDEALECTFPASDPFQLSMHDAVSTTTAYARRRSTQEFKPVEHEAGNVRETVAVFHHPEDLQDAIDELLNSGFHRAELSLLASEHAVNEKLGHLYKRVGDLADDATVPRAAYVSPEAIGGAEGGLIGGLVYIGAVAAAGAVVASGGTLASIIAAAAVAGGAGGFIGSILAKWVGDHHASYLQEQMDHGGLLLWVRTWEADDERRAVAILKKHSGSDVHVHALVREGNRVRLTSWICSEMEISAKIREK